MVFSRHEGFSSEVAEMGQLDAGRAHMAPAAVA
jgi:hypothetical protein